MPQASPSTLAPETSQAFPPAESKTSRLRAAYLAECTSRACPPIAPLVEALDAHLAALANDSTAELSFIKLNGNAPRLFEARVSDDQAVALALALGKTHDCAVRDLDLSYNKLGDAAARALAATLCLNKNIHCLSLRGNEIGPGGCDALAKVLEGTAEDEELPRIASNAGSGLGVGLKTRLQKTSLQTLDLSRNLVTCAGGVSLANALRTNTTLTRLDLTSAGLGLKALSALCGAVSESNKTLKWLSLEAPTEFSVADEHAWPAARMLGANETVAHFFCGKWGLKSTPGLETLVAYGLCYNNVVETLDLRCNKIDETGGEHVARALRNNVSLKRLNLEENKLGDAGAESIADALGESKTLQELDLRCNGIAEKGLTSLATGFRHMTNSGTPLRLVRVWGNDFGAPGSNAAVAWRDALAEAREKGHDVKADITFRTVDGLVHVARMTEVGTKEVGNRF
jgi:Ran GTPase-activating protein (RanGAP) involved in mRNA processing and transport